MTVFEQWQSYEREVVPAGAPMVQREECRRAFYAGGQAVFGLVMAAVDPESSDECEDNLQALQAELQAMVADLRMT